MNSEENTFFPSSKFLTRINYGELSRYSKSKWLRISSSSVVKNLIESKFLLVISTGWYYGSDDEPKNRPNTLLSA